MWSQTMVRSKSRHCEGKASARTSSGAAFELETILAAHCGPAWKVILVQSLGSAKATWRKWSQTPRTRIQPSLLELLVITPYGDLLGSSIKVSHRKQRERISEGSRHMGERELRRARAMLMANMIASSSSSRLRRVSRMTSGLLEWGSVSRDERRVLIAAVQ